MRSSCCICLACGRCAASWCSRRSCRRMHCRCEASHARRAQHEVEWQRGGLKQDDEASGAIDSRARSVGGGKRDRTADLLHAMQALSQLSYTPLQNGFVMNPPLRRIDDGVAWYPERNSHSAWEAGLYGMKSKSWQKNFIR
ncbi:hypothetical protein PUN4_630045 [Paraburkholderia unamae]|nr:hypothetical protein PUN4_630045 [Paraburkholderia unamae]